MTTTTDTKVFVGILRKSFLEPNKSGEGAHWHIDLGDLQKPWGFNMFDKKEGERLALGKTYEITYVLKKNEKKPQFPPFKNFVSIREVEPAPAKPAGSPGEGVGEPEPPDPHRRSIERQTALKAAVEFASMWTHPQEIWTQASVLEYAEAFYQWIANDKLPQANAPAEQASTPALTPQSQAAGVTRDVGSPAGASASQVSAPPAPASPDKRTALLAMKPANLGDFYNKAMKELGYHSKAEVLAGLGVGMKETDIAALAHALQTLVLKKYPEAKEA